MYYGTPGAVLQHEIDPNNFVTAAVIGTGLGLGDNARAALAIDVFEYGVKKLIGSYAAAMNGVDAIVFTAGIGENDAALREAVCEDMDFFGINQSYNTPGTSGGNNL